MPRTGPRRPAPGKSLLERNPAVAAEWSESNELSPADYTFSSAFKAAWKCRVCSHEWSASINSRASGKGCPQCYRLKRASGIAYKSGVPGNMTFAELHADKLSWWSEKNDIDPHISYVSGRSQVWWRCPKGHSFQTCLRNFNFHCKACSLKPVALYDNLMGEWDHEKNEKLAFDPLAISYNSAKRVWWKCPNGHSWEAVVYARVNSQTGCPLCNPHQGSSKGEKELAAYIESLGFQVIRNARRHVPGVAELDVVVPDRNMAFEFNGVFFHCEGKGKGRRYHYDKWKACRDAGIQLVTIWDDDWESKNELVRKMVAHKLNASEAGSVSSRRVFARSTRVVKVDSATAREFLDEHHIQGFVQGTSYIGLRAPESDDLVAVSVWRRGSLKNPQGGSETVSGVSDRVLYLDRYATSCSVVGGAGKLLKAGVELAKSISASQIITFADHAVSDGDLYDKLGFRVDREIRPDYFYLHKGKRFHKFNFRRRRFEEDSSLTYVESMSESEMAKLNGIERIWDCGKTRYVLDL